MAKGRCNCVCCVKSSSCKIHKTLPHEVVWCPEFKDIEEIM